MKSGCLCAVPKAALVEAGTLSLSLPPSYFVQVAGAAALRLVMPKWARKSAAGGAWSATQVAIRRPITAADNWRLLPLEMP